MFAMLLLVSDLELARSMTLSSVDMDVKFRIVNGADILMVDLETEGDLDEEETLPSHARRAELHSRAAA